MSDSAQPPSSVETVLSALADQAATGCLAVRDPEGDEAHVYLREGGIYAVNVPGRRAMLGVRLVSSGALSPEALAEALEVQRTELEGWRLGELLIHLGYVDAATVEASVVDHMTDALADLVGRPMAGWRFRKRKKTRQDTGPKTPVQTLFDDLRERSRAWETILDILGTTDVAPTLPGEPKPEDGLEANELALLKKIDGRRTVADLAGECGFTLFEAGQVVVRLLRAGYLLVPGRFLAAGAGALAGVGIEGSDDERGFSAEAERRAAEDRERAAAERKAEALRKAEAKNRAEAERRKVAAEHRRVEAERAEALELQRIAAERKQEQAERIRAAAAERDEAAKRRRELLEAKRLEDAELLHRELEAAALREATERQAALDAQQLAEQEAEQVRAAAAAQSAERVAAEAAQSAERAAAEEAIRLAQAAEEAVRLAQEADERSVREEAERITREDAEQRTRAEEATAAAVESQQDSMMLSQASSLLTQLNQEALDSSLLVPAQSSMTSSAAETASPEEDMTGPVEPQRLADRGDTAMLLRELSSLNFGGGDDRPLGAGSPAKSTPRATERPATPVLPTEAKNKKRKGIFGRG